MTNEIFDKICGSNAAVVLLNIVCLLFTSENEITEGQFRHCDCCAK